MNDLERAVIDAARAFTFDGADSANLQRAVFALRDHEASLTASGLAEVSWAQVAEGDELRGRSGEFYPVVATKREWQMGKPTGNFLITVKVGGKERVLSRSVLGNAKATVRRGAAGKAVDQFVHVFASGEL